MERMQKWMVFWKSLENFIQVNTVIIKVYFPPYPQNIKDATVYFVLIFIESWIYVVGNT